MPKSIMQYGKSATIAQSLSTPHETKNNIKEGPMEMVGKPHVAKSIHGLENYGHTKEVAPDAKILWIKTKQNGRN